MNKSLCMVWLTLHSSFSWSNHLTELMVLINLPTKTQKDIQSSHSRVAFGSFWIDKYYSQILRNKSQTLFSFLRFNSCDLRSC